LNTVPGGATGYIGGDGSRDTNGAAANNTDADYAILTTYVANCAQGGYQGAILITKNS
jgi:hypothetical protein